MWIVILIAAIILYSMFHKSDNQDAAKKKAQYQTPQDAYDAETAYLYRKAFQEIRNIRDKRKYVQRYEGYYYLKNNPRKTLADRILIAKMDRQYKQRELQVAGFLREVEDKLKEYQRQDPATSGQLIRDYIGMTDKTLMRVRMQFLCEPKGSELPKYTYSAYKRPEQEPASQPGRPSYDYRPNTEDLDYQAELLRQQQQEDYERFQDKMHERNTERERIDRMRREGLVIEADEAEAAFHQKFGW